MPAEGSDEQHGRRHHRSSRARPARHRRRTRRRRDHRRRRRARPRPGGRAGAVGARRRPRLGVGERAGVGVRAHDGRASPGRQGGHRHRAGRRPRRVADTGPDPARGGCRGPARPRRRRARRRSVPPPSPASPTSRPGGGRTSSSSFTVQGRPQLDLPVGTTFSVLATHGVAEGVTVQRSPLAVAGPSPRAARRPRCQQPGQRATRDGVGRVGRHHDRRSGRGVMTRRMRFVGATAAHRRRGRRRAVTTGARTPSRS